MGAAAHLQIEEAALAAVCACEAPITADLAIRFEQAFGSTSDTWLRLQNAYHLAKSRKSACGVKRIKSSASSRRSRMRPLSVFDNAQSFRNGFLVFDHLDSRTGAAGYNGDEMVDQ